MLDGLTRGLYCWRSSPSRHLCLALSSLHMCTFSAISRACWVWLCRHRRPGLQSLFGAEDEEEAEVCFL